MESRAMTQGHTGLIDRMFKAGAHFAYSRTRRHPSVEPFIFGVKNQVEIFDLEKVSELFHVATAFAKKLGEAHKTILFVGGKNEARDIVAAKAQELGMPYVAGRWIGGTLTNFSEIKKRLARLEDLIDKRAKKEFEGKYTKRERLMFDREIEDLRATFGGIADLKQLPSALFVVDSRREHLSVAEAKIVKIPVIALMNSDCNLKDVTYPVVANDSARTSITFFLDEIIKAYRAGTQSSVAGVEKKEV